MIPQVLIEGVREDAVLGLISADHTAIGAIAYRILAEQPLHPEKVKYCLERRDPECEAKMREVLLVYQQVALQNQNGGVISVVTVSVDEKPGLQAIANTALGPAAGTPPAFQHRSRP